MAETRTILLNPRLPDARFQDAILQLLGIADRRLVWLRAGVVYMCDELILPSPPCLESPTQLAPWARKLILAHCLPLAEGTRRGRRIYISRRLAKRRRIVNEDNLVSKLADRGVETVELEGMDFRNQVQLFASADLVIGCHGAGLTNILFSASGCRLLEIVPTGWHNRAFVNLAQQGEIQYRSAPAVSLAANGYSADVGVDAGLVLAALGDWP